MKLGKWQLDTVSGGTFLIDGGATYGAVPKTVWEKFIPCDDNNRIRLACHCVLARKDNHVVLIDTGYGGKYPPLDRKVYGMQEGSPILESLAALGIAASDVDTVVFSHLHFDHAGGATSFDHDRQLSLAFPRARHVVGRFEWEDAVDPAPELQAAYIQNDIIPLRDADCVDLVDDGDIVVPGLRAIRTGGHTRGHLALQFESEGQSALYIGDICPTTAHVRLLWGLAYDTFQLTAKRRKKQLLELAAANSWWVIWNHDPTTAASRVAAHPTKEFEILDPRPVL